MKIEIKLKHRNKINKTNEVLKFLNKKFIFKLLSYLLYINLPKVVIVNSKKKNGCYSNSFVMPFNYSMGNFSLQKYSINQPKVINTLKKNLK